MICAQITAKRGRRLREVPGRPQLGACLAVIILFTSLACGTGVSSTTGPASVVIKPQWVLEDADWMMGAVISGGPMDGAFATYPDQQHIMPYFANLGALGLARASQISGRQSYLQAVWRHLSWYAGQMDREGFVRDYDVVNGIWQAAPNAINKDMPYDSTDSYAGTFLLALRAAYRVHHDTAQLARLGTAVTRAVAAIQSTQDSDGLTWARPGYKSKILMDSVETYQGMLAGAELFGILGDAALATSARRSAQAMASGIESLWDRSKGYYYLNKDEYGSLESPRWSQLDPGAMAQAWVVSFQVGPPDRARTLMREFGRNQGRWDQPASNKLESNYDVTPVGWAYLKIGDTQRARQAAVSLRNGAVASQRAWPFSFGTCGELIILETDGIGLVFG